MGWMAHRKWKEIKQQPGTAGPGNMLGCCLVYFHFRCDIHPIRPVDVCTSAKYRCSYSIFCWIRKFCRCHMYIARKLLCWAENGVRGCYRAGNCWHTVFLHSTVHSRSCMSCEQFLSLVAEMLIASRRSMNFDKFSRSTLRNDDPELGVMSNPITSLILFQCLWRIPGLQRHMMIGICAWKVKLGKVSWAVWRR